ncbi:MAG: flagellar FlbD family protein [Actinobacteria bacterium]|uniref:Flagellar protein FlbD n=1 Tax=hydrothermal vent metagenome TaxID=652676 RepID=A0A3B0STE0_9ZZZZ|nr:flagellar FlbD family protein [Actinomycetota bacterium]
MIIVHRLKGEQFFLNADLVESVESTPDTVVTLVDGRRMVVADSPQEIAQRVVEFRAAILVSASQLRDEFGGSVVSLRPDDGSAP